VLSLEWLPSRRNIYRTLKAHKAEVPDLAFWTHMFSTYKAYLEHQFDEEYLHRRMVERTKAKQERRMKRQ
jgi:hypothetical protein